jgi:histidine triad (HIT) family protein
MGCVFCKIIAEGRERSTVIFEDDRLIALLSLHQKPRNQGHALLLPKTHVPDICMLPASLDAPLMAALRRLAAASKKAFEADGIHIRQNNQPASGQDIFHLHFHVVPRFDGDDFDSERYKSFALKHREGLTQKLRAALPGI